MPYLNIEPKDIITLYYNALYSGDLPFVKGLMTTESYMMTLETFGLRLSMRDRDFKAKLKEIDELLKDDDKFLESLDQVALQQLAPEALGLTSPEEPEKTQTTLDIPAKGNDSAGEEEEVKNDATE